MTGSSAGSCAWFDLGMMEAADGKGFPDAGQEEKMNGKRRGMICAAAVSAAIMAGLLTGETVDAEESGSLNLYMSTWELEAFQPAIDRFQQQYPGVELEIETWDPYSASLFGEAEKLSARLMAGEGPDLLISENYPTQDLMKLMKAQVYAPLDEFMAQEDIWNDENYVMPVIDCGKFDGIQYVMPLTYKPLFMISSEEALEEAHLTEEKCPDTLSLLKGIAALYDTDYSERILADCAQLSLFPLCIDGDFLDYQNGTIGTDPELLREACEAYARIYEEDMNQPDNWGEAGGYGTAIVQRRAYCYFTTYAHTRFVMECADAIAASETPAILPLRNAQGESLAAIQAYAGIRANSENKQNAWNMLRIMLEEEAQKAYAASKGTCSVLRAGMEEVFGTYAEKEAGEADFPASEPGEAFMDEFRSLSCQPQKCVFISNIVVSEFKGRMEPFYLGEANYEECIGDFEDFAKIYLTE